MKEQCCILQAGPLPFLDGRTSVPALSICSYHQPCLSVWHAHAGVDKRSADTWVEPHLFRMDKSTGEHNLSTNPKHLLFSINLTRTACTKAFTGRGSQAAPSTPFQNPPTTHPDIPSPNGACTWSQVDSTHTATAQMHAQGSASGTHAPSPVCSDMPPRSIHVHFNTHLTSATKSQQSLAVSRVTRRAPGRLFSHRPELGLPHLQLGGDGGHAVRVVRVAAYYHVSHTRSPIRCPPCV